MVDVILDTQDVRVLGGPDNVTLDLDFGKQGNRGSYIYAGYGKPVGSNLPSGYQIKDLYINLDPNDNEYSCVYQYITSVVDNSDINEWQLLLRMSPEISLVNTTASFTAGESEISIYIDNIFPLDIANQIRTDNVNMQISFINDSPVSYAISNVDIVSTQNPPKVRLTATVSAAEFSGGTWSELSGAVDVNISLGLAYDYTIS